MSRSAEWAMEQQEEQENLSGAFDQEFAEWVAAHEKDEQAVQTEFTTKH